MRFLAYIVLLVSCSFGQTDINMSLNIVTPELVKTEWYKYVGFGLNMLNYGELNANGVFYKQNVWYTLGKGTIFIDEEKTGNKHVLAVNEGNIILESVSVKEPPMSGKQVLKISYDLTYPISIQKGAAFVTLVANIPLEGAKVGQAARLSIWEKSTIVAALHGSLIPTGTINTFSGDIFTEQSLRPYLSYSPPEMVRGVLPYEVTNPVSSVQVTRELADKFQSKLKDYRRLHAGNGVKAMSTRQGFVCTPQWEKVIMEKGFILSADDIASKTLSLEITLQLPSQQNFSTKADTISGIIYIGEISWWLEN